VTPRTAIESSFNHKKKQQRTAEKTAKPKPISAFLPKSPLTTTAESDAHRIETIRFLLNRKKAEYLEQFKEKGYCSVSGVTGVVIEPDLKAAGLFD